MGGIVYQILFRAKREHLKLQMSKPVFKGGDSVFIINHSPYTPMTPLILYKTFKRFMNKTCPNLPCYRLHDLRHTYFTLCSNIEGFSELSLIGTGGHSTIQSSKRYIHPQWEKMLDDMQKLEKAYTQMPTA